MEEGDISRLVEKLALIENQHVDAYRTLKISKFFRKDPISFFVIVEASFRQARIYLKSTKADYVVANLDHDLISNIKHILEMEPKHRLISTFRDKVLRFCQLIIILRH